MLVFEEVLEELKRVDEITLLEMLDVTSEEIVNHFRDKIEDNIDKFQQYVIDNREDIINYE